MAMNLIETKMRSNLLEWAEKAGAKFHRAGHEWRSACPLHGGNNNDAFAVYTENGAQKWKCFTGPCGQGDIYDFITLWQSCDLQAAYQMLGGDTQPDPAAVARAAAEQARRAEIALKDQIERAQRALHELQQAQSWLAYHEEAKGNQQARQLWERRGIPQAWQDFWELGFCKDFAISSGDSLHHTPTLTIPIKDCQWNVVNVRHRLLNPVKPNDKYRPDRPGLPAAPFMAHPGISLNNDRILVVEGEIKSMVTYQTMYTSEDKTPQVIGIPGKTQFRHIAEALKGHDVWICFDPDAGKEALEAARMVNGKIITLPMKIDDAILARELDATALAWRMATARKA